jgi:uncharacterized integral membrane protein
VASERPASQPAEFSGTETPTRPLDEASADSAAVRRSGEQRQIQAKPPRTRTSTAFSGFVAGAIVLILLLVFILENTQSVKISYFGATGHVALGVALLLAAVGGALLVGLLGLARIAQLRRHTKRHSNSRRH